MVLKNASVPAQIAWANMTPKQRSEIVRKYKLKDTDRDGVYNGFDCHPKDRKRQESFLPSDRPFVASHNTVTGTKCIGRGYSGEVYSVNKNMVVKIQSDDAIDSLDGEIKFITENKTSKAPLIVPTKLVKAKVNGKVKTGLLRPLLTPVSDPAGVHKKAAFTDSRLKELRLKIIKMSYAGYVFDDGYQLGIDRAGRILQFDVGGMVRVNPREINTAFRRNNALWLELLDDIGKPVSKIGKIARTPEMDTKVTAVSKPKTSTGSKRKIVSGKSTSTKSSKSKKSSK